MKFKTLFTVCLGLAAVLPFSADGQTLLDRFFRLRKTESDIEFYGRITDQDGRPVAGAEIQYSINRYSLFGAGWLNAAARTDENGAFEVHEGKGSRLYIDSIKKYGYQWLSNKTESSFEFRHFDDHYTSDPAAPAPFIMRRKDIVGTFLLEKKMGFGIELAAGQSDNSNGIDIGRGAWFPPNRKIREGYFIDFETNGEFNPEKKEWTLHISINGENAGLQTGNELLYEAPADGYQKELTVTVACGGAVPCQYIYARLRNPGMYARMTLDKGNSRINEQQCKISWDIFINPYGDRSLEELDWAEERFHEYCLCDAAAEKALEKQQLAERPDFAQMLKDGIVIY